MKEWLEIPLKDLVEIETGKKDANEGNPNGIYRFYTCAKNYSFIDNYVFDKEVVLVSGNGAYVGYVHYFKGKFDAYQRTYVLSNFKADVFYLYHFLGEHLKIQIQKQKQDTATPYITRGVLANFKVKLPENPAEQTAIATILSKVDEAIEATQNSIKTAEKLKKALMQNLLTGKLKPDGTWRTDNEFYEDEKFGKVPVGWEIKKLKDLTKLITDGVHSTPNYQEKGIPFLSVTDLRGNKISFENCKYISEEEHKLLIRRCKPEIGDILMGKVATLGVCDIVETDIEFSIFVQIALIKPNENVIGDFLKYKIQSTAFNNLLYSKAAGTTIKYIGIDSISKVKIILPNCLTEQQNIADKLTDVDKNLESKQIKIRTLQRLKKSLMQNLLTGKVRLSEAFITKFEEIEETIKS